jgi:hypothetical protein
VLIVHGCGSDTDGNTEGDTDSPNHPLVTVSEPNDGATGIALNTNISVTFDRDMAANTVDTSSFFLQESQTTVASNVTYDSATRTATLSPTSLLRAATQYQVTATTAIESSDGNPLESNFTWSFTTGNWANDVLDYDINMIIMYGQSLSVRPNASNPSVDSFEGILSFPGGPCETIYTEYYGTLDEFYGTGFVPLGSISIDTFTPITASALAWVDLINSENGIDMSVYPKKFVLSSPGWPGAPIADLEKGTTRYSTLISSVQKAKEFAANDGKSFGVPVVFWVQGESDQGSPTYYDSLSTLYSDLNSDIKTITGQSKEVAMITYQTSPHSEFSSASFDQLRLAQTIPNVYLGGAMYQYRYEDDFHPLDNAVTGIQLGVAAKRINSDGQNFRPFAPVSHTISYNTGIWELRVQFDVPVPPMRFHVSGDDYHNINGKQINYGFALRNSSDQDILIEEPIFESDNVLLLKCTEDPSNARLSYAVNGHFGGGNLGDSQNITFTIKGNSYTIDNFGAAFKDYAIQ